MRRATVRVERASPADLDALLAMDVPLVARDRQDAIVCESVRDGGCLVARIDDGPLAGYVTWDLGFFHRPFVRLLAIARPYRRRGLGSALLRGVEDDVRARHGTELFISTESINAPMRTLVARAGYAASGSIDNVNEPGNLELVYHKRLARAP